MFDVRWFKKMLSCPVPSICTSFTIDGSEVFGVCGRWRRNPCQNATDQQMEKVRGFFRGKELL
jgi:hypothetical protein